MALQNLVGTGLWMPPLLEGITGDQAQGSVGSVTLDADEEEAQFIGHVRIVGNGSKTFGTSGAKICWLGGSPITFQAVATLRIGIKKTSTIDTVNGPPARATIGAAAFDVYKDLVGGTDTITASAWREDAMASGTPFTIADGDLIAVCFHLDITSAAQSVLIRAITGGTTPQRTFALLVTAGPTYTASANIFANLIIIFDDGTLGWLEPSFVFSNAAAVTGTTALAISNSYANIFRVPFSCKVDALMVVLNMASAVDLTIALWQTPLGTPSILQSVAIDGNVVSGVGANRPLWLPIPPTTLSINTDYAVGFTKDSGAGNLTGIMYDVTNANYFQANGMGAECYAANSTAGATFAAANSGLRRYIAAVRISALDDGAGGGAVAEASYSLGI